MIVELTENCERVGLYEVDNFKEAIEQLAVEEGYEGADEFLSDTGRSIFARHVEAEAVEAIYDILNRVQSLQTEIELMEDVLDELGEALERAEDPSDDYTGYVSVQKDASEIVYMLKDTLNSSGDLLQHLKNTEFEKSVSATFSSS